MTGTVAETASRSLDVPPHAPQPCALDEDPSAALQRQETRRAATRRSIAVPTVLAPRPASIAPQWRVMAVVVFPEKIPLKWIAQRPMRRDMWLKIL